MLRCQDSENNAQFYRLRLKDLWFIMHNAQFIIDSSETQNIASLLVGFDLPLSKSVRARELVLDALSGFDVKIEEDNDDLFVLSRALYNSQFTIHNSQLSDKSDWSDESDNSQFSILNLRDSGTALRFMTAFCAVSEGEYVLTGSKRLCERPIKPLVDALCRMGAKIEYVDKEGFAPLRIKGGNLKGGKVSLDASLSSQFVSALMLIADKVEGGVDIEYEGDVASEAYIRLTEKVIERYRRGERRSEEKDWSSATVWYAAMAVLRTGRFLLEGLSLDSCQPDRAIVDVFEKLGVRTIGTEMGVIIEANCDIVDKLVVDCKNMPDAVMYIAVAACVLGVDFEIRGIETLRVKESDRIEVLITEMEKCGFEIIHNSQFIIHNLKTTMCDVQYVVQKPLIKTYNDHRVAMAMAVVGLVREIDIENPEVVSKSYPGFWEEIRKIKNRK
ncbi:MAG: hypothetical protein IJY67_08800 [Paludibacteraceae bacterium]|nr:hypothetical protein [Paludibacteraceae bacterium]